MLVTLTTLLSFNGTNGESPSGSLTLSADGSTLYGMTYDGGANDDGTIFSIPVTGGTPTILFSFNGTNGEDPDGSLTLSGSTLYGMTDYRRGKRRRHHFQHSGDRRHSHDPALVQRHERRSPRRQFDAQWINALWDDPRRRGKRRRHHFQHSGDRRHSHDPALVQRHERRRSRRQFDAQWINTLWDDRPTAGQTSDGTIFSIPVTGGTPTTLLSFNGTNGATSR